MNKPKAKKILREAEFVIVWLHGEKLIVGTSEISQKQGNQILRAIKRLSE
jgi:hypothetical protein